MSGLDGTDAAAGGHGGGLSITPVPTEEEAAAIAAAVQVAVLSGAAVEPERRGPSRWRFSGRWWSRPVPVRRARPGR